MNKGAIRHQPSNTLNSHVRVTLTRPLPLTGERGTRREGVRVTGAEGMRPAPTPPPSGPLAVPGLTRGQAQTVARVKAAFDGEVVEVRPRQREEAP